MENDEVELFEFIELQNNLEYFDCLPICFYNGIWYIYYAWYIHKYHQKEVFSN